MLSRAALLVPLLMMSSFAADERGWFPARVVSIEYPILGLSSNAQGVVLVECLVAADGSVTGAGATGGHSVLRNAVLERIREWKFRFVGSTPPATPSNVTLTFEFRLEGPPAYRAKTTFIYEYPYKVVVASQAYPTLYAPATVGQGPPDTAPGGTLREQ